MASIGFSCAWCARPLIDREHALQHGPLCSASPVVCQVRASSLLDAADQAEELAWAAALKCPPWEARPTESRDWWMCSARLIAGAQVKVLTDLAGGLRVLAAMALEGR